MLTPGQKLAILNKRVNFQSPMYQVLYHLAKKNKIQSQTPDFERRILAKKLDMKTKAQIFQMQRNWQKQKYKYQRCKVCELEIPGGQDVMIMHLNTHFGKYTEHKSRIEQIQTHPYTI